MKPKKKPLKRISSDPSGVECDDCGDDIAPGRLLVHPNAKCCVNCQSVRERKGQFQRHVMDIQPEVESVDNVGTIQTLIRAKN